MIQIIPAIMPSDLEEVESKVSAVAGATDIVQLDIMDGMFVPEKTWPYRSVADAVWPELAGGAMRLPFLDKVRYELDLMVHHPEDVVEAYGKFGPSRIIIHVESVGDMPRLLGTMEHLRDRGVQFGLAVNNQNGFDFLKPHITHVDFVQVMGIGRIGYQGEPFDTRAITLIQKLRELHPTLPISIDGGVHIDTIYDLHGVGISWFVAGSAVYAKGDPYYNVLDLKKLVA